MDHPDEASDQVARAELLQVVLIVHHYLPQSDLSVRERVDVRRDLGFLVSESRRPAFRRTVALELCAAVLAEVAPALPTRARETMVRTCASHLGWTVTRDRRVDGPVDDLLAFVRPRSPDSSSEGDTNVGPPRT